MAAKKPFTPIFFYFSKPLRLLYSLIIYEIVNFSFFALYSLLLLSFFLYLKSVPIYVIVHVIVTLLKLGSLHVIHVSSFISRLSPLTFTRIACFYCLILTPTYHTQLRPHIVMQSSAQVFLCLAVTIYITRV